MSKFYVKGCINSENKSFVVITSSEEEASVNFPINPLDAKIVESMLKCEDLKKINISDSNVGIYRTILESLHQGNRFISGFYLDEKKGDIIASMSVSCMSSGLVESVSSCGFTTAVILAALSKTYIHLSENLSNKFFEMLNPEDAEKAQPTNDISEDMRKEGDAILSVAEEIMLGKSVKKKAAKTKIKKKKQEKPLKEGRRKKV
jgi:hypothetical protein